MANTLLIFLLTTAFFHVSLSDTKYNYNTSDTKYGPNGWANEYPSCKGSRQSPIDIKPSEASYDGSLGELTFTRYDDVPAGTLVRLGNNGKSFRVFFEADKFLVSGGGLPGTFYTLNFHAHWGADDNKGSEHTIDGKKFPLEIHFVNVNTKYDNVTQALEQKDGIAVLGVLYEVGDEDVALEPFLKYTANVTYVKDISNVTMTQSLQSLLPNTTEFYRYDGSLTTPLCQEVVTWTVFKNYRTVSQAQLNMLRSLRTADNVTMLVDTFRPVQPLDSRVVKKTFKTNDTTPTSGTKPTGATSHHVVNSMTIIVSLALAMVISK